MGTSSFQVCMDDDSSADWLLQHQGTVTQDIRKMDAYDSSSSSEMLMSTTCSTLMDRSRLIIPRPQHEQSPKCPRCDSTHTKFCYYNNYSLSQPRYFCKTCRRYWTKGGTLRNIPVGGGCRKNNNKKQLSSTTTNSSSSSSKNNNYIKPSLPPTYKNNNNNNNNSSSSPILNINQQNNIGVISTTNSDDHFHHHDQLMHFSSLHMTNPPMSFLLENINHETSTQIHDQLIMDHQNNNFNIYNSPIFGSNYNNILESDCQRTLMMPYDDHESYNEDVKPINNNSNGGKINLSLELLHHHQQQQQASTTDFVGGLGSSWTGLMNGYGSSATNPLLFN